MKPFHHIKAIVFDADDTLWALQNHFEYVEDAYCALLEKYGSKEEISASLFATETANMEDLGYGVKAFIISLVENAIKVSNGEVSAELIGRIVSLGKSLLHVDATPLPEVASTLKYLAEKCQADVDADRPVDRKLKLAVFTKGELKDQENKLKRSGLLPCFDDVRIVSDKTPQAYHQLCRELDVHPEEMVMVGNSFKSDIAPALEIGAYAIHIPFHTIWAHEKIDEFEHERLRCITHFSEIIPIVEGKDVANEKSNDRN